MKEPKSTKKTCRTIFFPKRWCNLFHLMHNFRHRLAIGVSSRI